MNEESMRTAPETAEPETAEQDVEGAADANGDEVSEEGSRLEQEIEALRGQLEALNDRHLRLAAEFDNYRKRTDRERQSTKSAGPSILAVVSERNVAPSLVDSYGSQITPTL